MISQSPLDRGQSTKALEVDERFVRDLIAACLKVAEKVQALKPIGEKS